MNLDPRGFIIGLFRVIVPTLVQGLLAIFAALAVIVYFDYPLIFARLGISKDVLATAQSQSLSSVTNFLSLPILNDSSQVIYWIAAVVFGYVIIWLSVNGLSSSQTAVAAEMQTIDTAGWIPLMVEAGIKMAMGLLLVFYLAFFKVGFGFWLSLTPGAITAPGVLSVLGAIVGFIGLAAQLYGVVVLVQLTIRPWYRTSVAGIQI